MSTLSAHEIDVSFADHIALASVSFAVETGSMIGLIGPNGAGKTTLLRVLAGLLTPDGGAVALDDRPLASLPGKARARRIAYLPQSGRSQWALPVADLVTMGRIPHLGLLRGPGPDDRAAVAHALEATDTVHLAARPATALSGGEAARVMLARALAGEPEILLADEPVAGLDPSHALEAMERLAALAKAGAGVVVVLHDLNLAARFCDRLALLHEGRLAAQGSADETLTDSLLADVYGIEVLRGRRGDEPWLIPWNKLPPPRGH